jgi:hypothetical protein
MPVQRIFKNWKSFSAGLSMVILALIHLLFSIKAGKNDETLWSITLAAMIGGAGLIGSAFEGVTQDQVNATAALAAGTPPPPLGTPAPPVPVAPVILAKP